MKPEKRKEFIQRVLSNAAKRYTKIPVYNCRYSSFMFTEYIRPSDETVPIIDDFFERYFLPEYSLLKKPSKIDNKKKQFQILAAHLTLASTHRPLKLSLNKESFIGHKTWSYFIVDVVKCLHDAGRIELLAGKNFCGKGSGWLTCICPTEMFQAELLSKIIVRADPDKKSDGGLIVLKGKRFVSSTNKNTGKQPWAKGTKKIRKTIKYRDNKETKLLKEKLRKFNCVNSMYRVVVNDNGKETPITTDVHVVFNEELFKYNGRMYTRRFGYLNIPRETRKMLTISGEKTVELDYSALHPRLLYSLEGIQYDDDPYEAVVSGEVTRKVMKKMLLSLFNAKNRSGVTSAAVDCLAGGKKLKENFAATGYTIAKLLDEFIKVHAPISKYFLSKQGLRLMRMDSQIAYGVVEHFADQGKPCLPVHDSFVVRESDEEELRQVMQYHYGCITEKYSPDKRKYTCKIDKK
ncbi:hypothetical protein [Desulfopila aestuarii]|uniref:Uncharacterized protein n=1 Tax=Desulfopila aestuarii DSM 18488 TaxID=1121416 RepID=A0A1M7YBY8_9BACT|nr:hypothetical protein [Desulfopila aestuarii]SHO50089.1 hypothetical protein SAMN02745220_03245 [Desulfopila aestuarii DSM 18488]